MQKRHMIPARAIVILPLLAFSACAQFPELEGTVKPNVENSEYPRLLPLEPILAHANATTVDPVFEQANLQGRLAGLRARANRLRGSVLTGAEKQRLEQGLR